MSESKLFHDYRSNTGCESSTDPRLKFYIISSSYAYGGGCGGEGAGLETFPHLLAALESQLEWISDFDEDLFGPSEFSEECAQLEESISEIKAKGTDEGITPHFLSIDGNRVGYSTHAEGYWSVFAPNALDVFMGDLQDRIEEAAEDAGIDVDEESAEGEDEAEEEDEELSGLRAELASLKALQARVDIEAETFVHEFFELAGAYDERHC